MVILLLVGVSAWSGLALLPAREDVGPLSDTLAEVVIPSFELKDASLQEAVARMEDTLRADKSGRHMRVLYWDSPEFPKGFRAKTETEAPVIPGLEPLLAPYEVSGRAENPLHSLKLANIPFTELVRYISGLYDCTVGQKGRDLYVIRTVGRFGTPKKKVWKVTTPEHFGLSRSSMSSVDLRGYFQNCGVGFHEGDSAVYHPRAQRLVVHAFQEELDLVDAILPWGCSFRAHPPTAWEQAVEWLDYRREKVADAFYNVAL